MVSTSSSLRLIARHLIHIHLQVNGTVTASGHHLPTIIFLNTMSLESKLSWQLPGEHIILLAILMTRRAHVRHFYKYGIFRYCGTPDVVIRTYRDSPGVRPLHHTTLVGEVGQLALILQVLLWCPGRGLNTFMLHLDGA